MSKIPFETLKTAAGKRVRIAQDALEQLRLKKLISTPGTYLDFVCLNKQDDFGNFEDAADRSVHAVLATKGEACEVCALGSLLVGLSKNNGDFRSAENIKNDLSKYFSNEQMSLVEAFYENDITFLCSGLDWPEDDLWEDQYSSEPLERFQTKYPNDTKRLKTILENIVENRGEFVPPAWVFKDTK